MLYTQGLRIDGEYFDVPFASIKRTADFLDKYANRTEDGDLHRELIGVYYNYQCSFGTMDTATHERLFNRLSEPEEFHTIELPHTTGTYTFRAYISSVSDEFLKIYEDRAEMQNLQCKFIAKQPART